MEILIVIMLNIEETPIPCTWMIIFLHAQYVHNNLINNLFLAICLGVERSGFSELGVQQ
jgi:hypothetical protein